MRISLGVVVALAAVGCGSKDDAAPSAAPAQPAVETAAGPTPAPQVSEATPPAGPVPEPKVLGPEAPPKLDRKAASAGKLGTLTQGGAFASLTGTGDISSGFDDKNIYGGLLGGDIDAQGGGFGYGRSGFGPGGGGTGWGTIGTGRYGTINRGMRGRSVCVPTVSIGQPNAQGDLDKAIIRRYIKRNIQKLQYCYEKQLLVKAGISGTVAAQFVIDHEGKVSSASASGVDATVSSCVADVIKAIQFPAPKGGGAVQVNYPFTFRPADASCGAAAKKP